MSTRSINPKSTIFFSRLNEKKKHFEFSRFLLLRSLEIISGDETRYRSNLLIILISVCFVFVSIMSFNTVSCSSYNNCTTNSTIPNISSAHLYRTILIIVGGTILSLLTTVGNLLVLISFRINKQLRTVTNYFLLSLAVADFTIGCFSMPIFFTFFEMNHWPFNSFLCDVWLSVDYTMSNASVANLLLICFDRYLTITRPFTYRSKRTPKRASIMIGFAWLISCLIWTPVMHFSNKKVSFYLKNRFFSGFGRGHTSTNVCHQVNVVYHSRRKPQV